MLLQGGGAHAASVKWGPQPPLCARSHCSCCLAALLADVGAHLRGTCPAMLPITSSKKAGGKGSRGKMWEAKHHAATLASARPHPAPPCLQPSVLTRLQGRATVMRTSKQLLQQVQLPALLLQGARAVGACSSRLLRKRLGLLAQLPQNAHVALQHLQGTALPARASQCSAAEQGLTQSSHARICSGLVTPCLHCVAGRPDLPTWNHSCSRASPGTAVAAVPASAYRAAGGPAPGATRSWEYLHSNDMAAGGQRIVQHAQRCEQVRLNTRKTLGAAD